METSIWQKPFSCFFEKHAADPSFQTLSQDLEAIKENQKSLLELEVVYVTIGNPAFCLALYLTRFIFSLLCKSVDWFLYDNGICHERVNWHTFSRRVTAIKKYVNKKFDCQHDRWSDSIFRTFLSTVSTTKIFFKRTAFQEFFWMIYGLF